MLMKVLLFLWLILALDEPLHIVVMAKAADSLEAGKKIVQDLVDTVMEDYKSYKYV